MNIADNAAQNLRERLQTITDMNIAIGLLHWDQQTYMPKGGITMRAETIATLSNIAHRMSTDTDMRRLIESVADRFDTETDDGALARLARRNFERATRLPAELVTDLARTTALAEPAWVEARSKGEWNIFAPHLFRIVELQKQVAESYGYTTHPYDALLDEYEPGATKQQLEIMFDELKHAIVPLVRDIRAKSEPAAERARPLYNSFDEAKQEAFGREVITRFGYDWNYGRQDRTVHPFCISFTSRDVRITTRFDKDFLQPALFGTMHEAGHAMYEQGINPSYARTPLGSGVSMGVHESQSRLWENLVGRSREFWTYFYPRLQSVFPEAIGEVDFETFYRAVNTVAPSLIRVEADEVTYNLHTLLRFELEVALLDGTLTIAELPEAWNAKMKEYLGISPASDTEGALQDIHWSGGMFAYFPTYTIGNVLAVQLFDAAQSAHPTIMDEAARGEFTSLHSWLTSNIYSHGSKYEPQDLIERATGSKLNTAPYIRYLREKFGELYEL